MSKDKRPRRAGHRAMTKEEQAANRLITIGEAKALIALAERRIVEQMRSQSEGVGILLNENRARVDDLASRLTWEASAIWRRLKSPWYARLWQRLRRVA